MAARIFVILLFGLLPVMLQALPAFPGAEGYAADITHGRGGRVVIVTNTNSVGIGSLRSALESAGPRIIVFRTSGVINLSPNSQWYFESGTYSNFMVAGQTSPGGITITASGGNTPFFQYTSTALQNYVWRFVRFRVAGSCEHAYESYRAANFVIDHCDFSGGSDECFDICRVHDVTIQWSTICNSGPTGQIYGMLIAYNPLYNLSIHHNLMANHINRFPEMHWESQAPPNDGNVDMRNNVCYNGQNYFFFIGQATPAASMRLNLVGNYYKAGPNSPTDDWLYHMISLDQIVTGYESDNLTVRNTNIDRTAIAGRVPNKVSTPWTMSTIPVTTDSAAGAYNSVLDKAGAWPRDAMNTRTVNEVRTSTGQLRKTDDALITSGPAAPQDTDNDGMPDCWETFMGLNPNDSSDQRNDHDGDGYTNIEEYVNDVALCLLGEAPQNGYIEDGCPTDVEIARSRQMAGPGLSLAPNPVGRRGVLRISLEGPAGTTGEVAVYDIAGRRAARFSASDRMNWNPGQSGAAPGVYLVQWRAGNAVAAEKRVIVMP